MRYRALVPIDFAGRLYMRGDYVPLPEPLSALHRRFADVGVVAAEPEEPEAEPEPESDDDAC